MILLRARRFHFEDWTEIQFDGPRAEGLANLFTSRAGHVYEVERAGPEGWEETEGEEE